MVVGGALGLLLGKFLPEKYHGAPTERIVQGSMRMISYLSIPVLGLLVATAKNKFDSKNNQVEHFASNLMLLNRELTALGPSRERNKNSPPEICHRENRGHVGRASVTKTRA